MANKVTTQLDSSVVVIDDPIFEDELLTFGAGGTEVEGTLLARQAVDVAIVDTPDVGNTGDGTLVATVAGVDEIPVPGNYNFECTVAVAEGGIFKLEDPNGNIIADNLTLRVGAGLVTTFNEGGIQIVVTEGAADFIVGDKFALAVVANGKMLPFAIGGVAGVGIPTAILIYDVEAVGAGDESIRALISGSVREEKLIISADGDNSNITDAILDQLRDFTIVSQSVSELNKPDN